MRFCLTGLARPRLTNPLFLLGVPALFFGCNAFATTYYVATSGSDSNPGTSAAPFRHLSKAAAAATQPGDTVIVGDGTYDNEGVVAPSYVVTLYSSGTAGNPITFKAQNRGKAILDSMNTSTSTSCNGASAYINLYNASYIVIQGFVIQRGCDEGIHSNDSAHDITIRWNEIRNIANHTVTDQIGRDGIYINSTEYNFTFDGNVFHDIGRTDGTSSLHFDHGIYSHARNMTIINNTFYNMNRGWSIQLADGAANWLVSNNTFAFGNANGEAGQIMFWGNNSSITLHNNTFYLPNSAAMTRYAATVSGSFDHNVVYGVSSVISDSTGIGIGSNLMGNDPKFVNAATAPYDFRCQAGSPAIDSGVNDSAVPVDQVGTTRPQGSSTDIGAFEYGATASTPPPVISGVFVSSITSNSAVVNWTTDEQSTSSVQYGLSNYTNSTPTDSTMVTVHSVTISGLSPATLYHFRTSSTNSSGGTTLSSDSTFTTQAVPAPPPPPPPAATVSLSANPASVSMMPGSTASASISAAGSGTVSLSVSGLPGGVNATLSPNSCTAPCSSQLKFSAKQSAAPQTFTATVTGNFSGGSASTSVAVTIGAPSVTSSGDITTGLVAKWSFTEGGGNIAYDSSGSGNNATLKNPTWWVSGYGMTCWFNGNNSYGQVADNSSLAMTNQLTVAFWLRPSVNANTDPRVITKLYDWDVKLNGSNRYPQFDAGGRYAMLNYALPLITWHHVVFTFSNGVVNGYVDGVPVPMLANTFTGTETLATWAYGLFIATDQSNAYIGSLDDVRLYQRALSAADVAALYAALKPL